MISRGKRIHQTILATSMGAVSALQTPAKPGKLIHRKYAALLHRYYFFARIHNMKWDEIVTHLEQEFFISGPRIADLIKSRLRDLTALVNERPTLAQLAEKYPMYSWPKPNKTDIFKASKKHG